MGFTTTITCPTKDVPALMKELARAGFLVLDTGQRTTTDEGLFAEASLNLLRLPDAGAGYSPA